MFEHLLTIDGHSYYLGTSWVRQHDEFEGSYSGDPHTLVIFQYVIPVIVGDQFLEGGELKTTHT